MVTEQERLAKNEKIKESQKITLARRANQTCQVFKIKIDYSRLSKCQKEHLKMLFVEAKWMYNDALNFSKTNKIQDYDWKVNQLQVMNRNREFETKELEYIGSQMKQAVFDGIKSSIKTLATLKKKGYQKPGALKFISKYTSLNLKQYGNTYKFYNSKTMRIQGVPGKIKVLGTKQFYFDPEIEYANAKILNTPLGYYIAITTYRCKKPYTEKYLPEIGIDMGIKTSITTSDGEKIDVLVEETERLKRLQKKLFRQQKGSNNRYKTRKLLQREYMKLDNRKDDKANKIVAKLLKHEKVYMQDEQLSNWKKNGFGKKVHHSVLGRIKAKLVSHERVLVLDQWVATTKYCPNCGKKNDMPLEKRTYTYNCGYTKDRDIHSACNMIIMTKRGFPLKGKTSNVRRGPTEVKPVENVSSILGDSYPPIQEHSVKQEGTTL